MKQIIAIISLFMLTVFLPLSAQTDENYFTDGTNGYVILTAEDGTPTSEVRLVTRRFDGSAPNRYYGGENVPDEVVHDGKTYQVVEFGYFDNSEKHPSKLIFGKNMRKINIFKRGFALGGGFEVAEGNKYYKSIDGLLYSADGKTLLMCGCHFPNSTQMITIPDEVEVLGKEAFAYCNYARITTLPKQLKEIGESAFQECKNLAEDIVVPEGVRRIHRYAFSNTDVKKLTLPASLELMEDIGYIKGLENIVCLASVPPSTIRIDDLTGYKSNWSDYDWLDSHYYKTAVLEVPAGSKQAYQQHEDWGKFKHIVEIGIEKCATPVISYEKGKLKFSCDTEGAEFVSKISCEDTGNYSESEIALNATYTIRVYATRNGWNDSDEAVAKLCWIDTEPSIDVTGTTEITAKAVLVKAHDGTITIDGLENNQDIKAYTVDGRQIATTVSLGSNATMTVPLDSGEVVILKFGGKSIKVRMR